MMAYKRANASKKERTKEHIVATLENCYPQYLSATVIRDRLFDIMGSQGCPSTTAIGIICKTLADKGYIEIYRKVQVSPLLEYRYQPGAIQ